MGILHGCPLSALLMNTLVPAWCHHLDAVAPDVAKSGFLDDWMLLTKATIDQSENGKSEDSGAPAPAKKSNVA